MKIIIIKTKIFLEKLIYNFNLHQCNHLEYPTSLNSLKNKANNRKS